MSNEMRRENETESAWEKRVAARREKTWQEEQALDVAQWEQARKAWNGEDVGGDEFITEEDLEKLREKLDSEKIFQSKYIYGGIAIQKEVPPKNISEGKRPMVFKTLDSGERQEYKTGARRDTQEDKPRFDLISPVMLTRLAELMARGAKKYGSRNWEKGIPIKRFYGSMLRHMIQWALGDREEDHLAAVIFNAQGIIHTEEMIKRGQLPEHLLTDED